MLLTIEPRVVGNFWARSLVSFKHVFLVSVLRCTPRCAPLKYICSFKMSNWMRPAYLSHYIWMEWFPVDAMQGTLMRMMRMVFICSQYLRSEIVLSIWIYFPVGMSSCFYNVVLLLLHSLFYRPVAQWSMLLQVIEQAAQNGELTPLVLVVIRNRLELARHDVLLFMYT